jgi:uncharacterized membrane protein YfcA
VHPYDCTRPRWIERRAVALLTAADFLAGAINAAAGGGSLVSFPALIAVGYPPLLANVTNNIAVVLATSQASGLPRKDFVVRAGGSYR